MASMFTAELQLENEGRLHLLVYSARALTELTFVIWAIDLMMLYKRIWYRVFEGKFIGN